MRKFKLKALSVQIKGKVHRKEDNEVFEEDKEILQAYNAGFLVEIKKRKRKPKIEE